jgi:hypothetical protein
VVKQIFPNQTENGIRKTLRAPSRDFAGNPRRNHRKTEKRQALPPGAFPCPKMITAIPLREWRYLFLPQNVPDRPELLAKTQKLLLWKIVTRSFRKGSRKGFKKTHFSNHSLLFRKEPYPPVPGVNPARLDRVSLSITYSRVKLL